jgi:hypothetical protein
MPNVLKEQAAIQKTARRQVTGSRGKERYAGAPQHGGQRNQRQACQGSGVAAFYSFNDGNAKPFVFCAAGTIVRLFDPQIGVQLFIPKVAKGDEGLYILQLHSLFWRVFTAIPYTERRVKDYLATAHFLQLLQSIAMRARFADLLPIQRGNLIATDDNRASFLVRNRGGLFSRQAQRGSIRRFMRSRCFIDIRYRHGKWNA